MTAVALVTGGSDGLGLETAINLARAGMRVLVVGRNPAKMSRALDVIRDRAGSTTVESFQCDLSSQEEVRRLAAQVRERTRRIDLLVNNAGGVHRRRTVTVDGIEATFAVNHLAYYLLTRLLLDLVVSSAPARIVNVASNAHFAGTLDFEDLGFERGYQIIKAYARSKLCNVLFTRELARRLQGTGVTANAVHPGTVATAIWSGAPPWTRPILAIMKRVSMLRPEEGGTRITYVATSRDLEGVTGGFFDKNTRVAPSPLAQDDALARRLWDVSAHLTGLDP